MMMVVMITIILIIIIQELLAKKRRLEVQMRYQESGGSKFQRDNTGAIGSVSGIHKQIE